MAFVIAYIMSTRDTNISPWGFDPWANIDVLTLGLIWHVIRNMPNNNLNIPLLNSNIHLFPTSPAYVYISTAIRDDLVCSLYSVLFTPIGPEYFYLVMIDLLFLLLYVAMNDNSWQNLLIMTFSKSFTFPFLG